MGMLLILGRKAQFHRLPSGLAAVAVVGGGGGEFQQLGDLAFAFGYGGEAVFDALHGFLGQRVGASAQRCDVAHDVAQSLAHGAQELLFLVQGGGVHVEAPGVGKAAIVAHAARACYAPNGGDCARDCARFQYDADHRLSGTRTGEQA